MYILAQIASAIAIVFLFLSYQQKNKNKFLVLQIFSNIAYCIQYIFLFAISGVISSIISTIRSLVFYQFEKKNKPIPIFYLYLFIIIAVIAGIFTVNSIYAVIPILITIMYTYGTWQKKLKVTCLFGIIAGILWTIYSIIIGAYVSIIGSIFEFISGTIGFIKLKKKEQKKEII